MLNPPLSLLSNELLAIIVEHLAALLPSHKNLSNLSLSDRAFTQSCQKQIFLILRLGHKSLEGRIPRTLKKLGGILNKKPSFADQVRVLDLIMPDGCNLWIFNDRTFIHILRLLAKSPRPPHELRLGWALIENPIVVVKQLTQSFFSQTLTVLDIMQCNNVPLSIFLICPRLREVILDEVGVAEESYPDDQRSGREPPALERINYRKSQSLVKQMITPPPTFQTPVVLWSKLRTLTICPFEKEEMACLQPIFNAACNTLEELYLTTLCANDKQIPLAGLVNLADLPHLRVFAILASIQGKSTVLRDINIVLSRIPVANNITNLFFDFNIYAKRPFRGCLEEDWAGLCEQIIRVSAEKALELDLKVRLCNTATNPTKAEIELYSSIVAKTGLVFDYPKICTHYWDPTCLTRGLAPFPRGEIRGKCRLI